MPLSHKCFGSTKTTLSFIDIEILLGRVALGAQRPIVVKLSSERSVGRSVGLSVYVCLSGALWKNGGSDPDAVRHRRSDGSRDEAGSGVWDRSTRRGTFGGKFGARHCPQGPIGRTCATAPRRGPLAKLLWADLFCTYLRYV